MQVLCLARAELPRVLPGAICFDLWALWAHGLGVEKPVVGFDRPGRASSPQICGTLGSAPACLIPGVIAERQGSLQQYQVLNTRYWVPSPLGRAPLICSPPAILGLTPCTAQSFESPAILLHHCGLQDLCPTCSWYIIANRSLSAMNISGGRGVRRG